MLKTSFLQAFRQQFHYRTLSVLVASDSFNLVSLTKSVAGRFSLTRCLTGFAPTMPDPDGRRCDRDRPRPGAKCCGRGCQEWVRTGQSRDRVSAPPIRAWQLDIRGNFLARNHRRQMNFHPAKIPRYWWFDVSRNSAGIQKINHAQTDMNKQPPECERLACWLRVAKVHGDVGEYLLKRHAHDHRETKP